LQSNFGTSRLVHQLHSWTPVQARPSSDVAEHMSRWFDPLAAIRLQAAQQAGRTEAAMPAKRAPGTQSLAEDVQRVSAVLANAIAQDPLAGLALGDEDPGYAPYHQRHLELQRQMAQMVGAVRDHARHTLAAASPALRQLAMLDATFEELLAPREQALLPTVASLLERRFHQLRGAHRQVHETTGEPDDAAQWRKPGGWLHTFTTEWRQALLNELELRLEPAAGMVDALRHESGTEP
jgi:hypothetical protein